jgi:L-aminopeptidase/D-esterase-like protein
MTEKHPEIGNIHDVVIPVVGECDDSWLNEIIGRHVKPSHAIEAIEKASAGPVAEGSVGGGTGMITCDFKGGIGTSSRRVKIYDNTYTVGVLVMSNFGVMRDLRIDGKPIGRAIQPQFEGRSRREKNYGSIIAVLATDAPLLSHQLQRLANVKASAIPAQTPSAKAVGPKKRTVPQSYLSRSGMSTRSPTERAIVRVAQNKTWRIQQYKYLPVPVQGHKYWPILCVVNG